MKLDCSGIENGRIADRFGNRGSQFNRFGLCTYSLPFQVGDVPKDTVSFALFLEDKDAFPVSGGFSWVHWTACNILEDHLEENASISRHGFVQGLNSYISLQGGQLPKEDCVGYAGMSPPDAPHIYELTVYALDCLLDLQDGFLMNQMFRQMEGHILAQQTVKGTYSDN